MSNERRSERRPNRAPRLLTAVLAVVAYLFCAREFTAWHPAWLCGWLSVGALWLFVFRHATRDLAAFALAGATCVFAFVQEDPALGILIGWSGAVATLLLQASWLLPKLVGAAPEV